MIGIPSARIAHSIPGRLRLRFAPREVDPEALASLLARLSARPGVRSARYSPASGSVLVEYDPDALSEAALQRELPLLEAPVVGASPGLPPSTPAARAVSRSWWNADAWVGKVSSGRMDLRTLLPVALLLVAARQVLLQGELGAAPWHALLWYSYNLFYQFHPEIREPPPQPGKAESPYGG
jgi:hypothetical protein